MFQLEIFYALVSVFFSGGFLLLFVMNHESIDFFWRTNTDGNIFLSTVDDCENILAVVFREFPG